MTTIAVGGPFFDELKVGQVFEDAPSVTLTDGLATMQQAISGDRLRLPLDVTLSRAVTGREHALAHPALVCNVAIGQTTVVTQRVRANLFYRGLVLRRPVFIGDTLRTTTEVVALKQNTRKEGRPATGLAVLRMVTTNQDGEVVLDFWRCPMLPLRDPEADTGHADPFDDIPAELDADAVRAAVPDWDLPAYRARVPGAHLDGVRAGVTYAVESREVVTSAPELVRGTLNLAEVHVDAALSAHDRRLVYGGHTIAIAGAHLVRALPNAVSLLGWRSCDHTGPVFEGDMLRSDVTVETTERLDAGGIVDLRVQTYAARDGSESSVLDWRVLALMA